MTADDYNLFKIILDVVIALISLLLGSVAGVYVQYKWRITKKIKSLTRQKGRDNQATTITNSPRAAPQNSGEDSLSQHGPGGVQASIKDSPGASINLSDKGRKTASEEEATGYPATSDGVPEAQLNSTSQFLYDEVCILFERSNQSCDLEEEDYIKAEGYRMDGHHRPAATLYVRVFDPVRVFLDQTGEQIISASLGLEVDKLRSWSSDGHGNDSLDDIISDIEKIMFGFFQARSKGHGAT